jgi:ABC-2 type transport system ATP-binding protein
MLSIPSRLVVVVNEYFSEISQSLWEISEKYSFTTTTNLEGIESIYTEAAPGGFKIMKAANGIPTEVDIEVLFNATINGVQFK